MSETDRKPWDRRPGETLQSYKAFKHYIGMEDRSLIRLAVEVGKSRQLMTRWSADYDWQARVLAYDSHMQAVEMARKEKVRADAAERWQLRRSESAETSWGLASQLIKRASEMLKHPLYEETIEVKDKDGRPVSVTLVPAKWTLKDASLMIKVAQELRDNAIFQALNAEDDFNPAEASPDELRAYLAAKGVKALPGPDNA